jgi:hypothetical protein
MGNIHFRTLKRIRRVDDMGDCQVDNFYKPATSGSSDQLFGSFYEV